jgi:hypothetical protein
MNFCKGNCGREAKFSNWCSKLPIHCPSLKLKFNAERIRKISKTKKLQAKLGLNPMQNPEICKKNHSPERNQKAAETLKLLGKKGLLPQQIESRELKDKRRMNVSKALRALFLRGSHPRQRETSEQRKQRIEKVSQTLLKLAKENRLPMQNLTSEQRKKMGDKISETLRKGYKEGRIKLNDYGKKIPYYSAIMGKSVVLRSKWEKTVAEFLDKSSLAWQYEPFGIRYWSSSAGKFATTFPDFFIPSINTIIEVKGNGELKSVKTKDKIEGIKNAGYRVMLFGRKEITQIIRNDLQIVTNLTGGYDEIS